jgi:hypothetical protein
MRAQAPDEADRDAAGLPAGCKWYALRLEICRSPRVTGYINRNLQLRQGTNASKQVGIAIFMKCSGMRLGDGDAPLNFHWEQRRHGGTRFGSALL